MTTDTSPLAGDTEAALVSAERRRAVRTGIIWLVTGIGVVWLFALGTPGEDDSTFQIAVDPDRFLTVPSFWTSMVLGLAIVALAVAQLVRPMNHRNDAHG